MENGEFKVSAMPTVYSIAFGDTIILNSQF